MKKIEEIKIVFDKKFKVKIEKLRTNTSTYKTLSFTIYHEGNVVYQKSDIQKIYD